MKVEDINHPDVMLRVGAAYVRGMFPKETFDTDRSAFRRGIEAGLHMYRFERSGLPRIRKVLGILRGMRWVPGVLQEGDGLDHRSLLDVGSGRGTFLHNLLNEPSWHGWSVTVLDNDQECISDHEALKRSGLIEDVIHGDVTRLELDDNSFELSTMLEVLEHLEEPWLAAKELIRVTRAFCIVSVPSRPDNNPQHIQLLREGELQEMFLSAGAARIQFRYVHNHLIAVVAV